MFEAFHAGTFGDSDFLIFLTFKNESIQLSWCPDDPIDFEEKIRNRSYDARPAIGEFSFRWDDEYISFHAGTHWDGKGGHMSLKIAIDDVILESLENSLEEINLLIERHIEAKNKTIS